MKNAAADPEERRHDERQERVQPAEVAEHQVLRDQGHVVGQHHRAEHEMNRRPPQREAQPGERVAGERDADQSTDSTCRR